MNNRDRVRQIAAEAADRGAPLAWFEQLYAEADGDTDAIPWADMTVNPNLAGWLGDKKLDGSGKSALVVGCGLGDDAEALAALGFQVTAFDISPTCIDWCNRRFADSSVEYRVADLLAPPTDWTRRFDFVLEIYTLQALPLDIRQRTMCSLANLVAPAGTLLLIARGRDDDEQPDQLPWPLSRQELATLAENGLEAVNFEDYPDDEDPPVRRFRVEYLRAD